MSGKAPPLSPALSPTYAADCCVDHDPEWGTYTGRVVRVASDRSTGVVESYARVDLTPSGADIAFRKLADATKTDSAISDLVRFRAEAGRSGLIRA